MGSVIQLKKEINNSWVFHQIHKNYKKRLARATEVLACQAPLNFLVKLRKSAVSTGQKTACVHSFCEIGDFWQVHFGKSEKILEESGAGNQFDNLHFKSERRSGYKRKECFKRGCKRGCKRRIFF